MPFHVDEWIESFEIFKKYGVESGLTGATHDEVFAGPGDTSSLAETDIARLKELGWHKSEYGGFQTFV